jgi:hypothetical protein
VIDPNDDRLVLFNVDPDTAPANTLTPIDAIINPLVSGPGNGLPVAAQGQRYLLTEGTGSHDPESAAQAWSGTGGQTLVANANDIVEYTGTRWRVVFASVGQTDLQYVTNIVTGTQYEWAGAYWIKSYQGEYVGGTWSIVL